MARAIQHHPRVAELSKRSRWFWLLVLLGACGRDSHSDAARTAGSARSEQELLQQEALRRGYHKAPAIEHQVDQALAQSLLSSVVETPETATVSEQELETAYRDQIQRFVQPERRASKHLLAKLDRFATPATEAAAKALVEQVLKEASSSTASAVFDRYARQGGAILPFQLIVQDVPPLAPTDNAEKAYLDAMFSLAAPGLVPTPVRSGYGWHAILLTNIEPAKYVSVQDAKPTLNPEIVVHKRKTKLEALVAETRKRIEVQTYAQPMETALRLELSEKDPRHSQSAQ